MWVKEPTGTLRRNAGFLSVLKLYVITYKCIADISAVFNGIDFFVYRSSAGFGRYEN
jgi:hypothetical protein